MRCGAFVGLVCVAGCNPIFGLDPTILQDASGPGLDAPDGGDGPALPRIKITKLVVDNNPDGTPVVSRDLPVANPDVKIALGDAELVSATYTGNEIEFPAEYAGQPWRLVATLDGQLHEYQWTVDGAHITETPHFGNQSPAAVPAGSSYRITPAGLAANHEYRHTQFFTSGVWTDSEMDLSPLAVVPMSSTFPVDFTAIQTTSEPLLGPFGKPEMARGDWQLLVELPTTAPPIPQCFPSIGAAWDSRDLVAGGPTAFAPTWRTTPTPGFNIPIAGDDTFRFPTESTALIRTLSAYGYVPNAGVAAFNRRKRGFAAATSLVDRPLMVTLAECIDKTSMVPAHVDVPELHTSMTPVFYVQLTQSRDIAGDPGGEMGPLVTNVIQAASLDKAAVVMSAPLLRTASFDGQDLMLSVDSTPGAPDYSKSIALASPRFIELVFDNENAGLNIMAADDYVVTLHYIDGLTLVPVRVFHVTQQKVRIDSTVFSPAMFPSGKFIFEITARRGLPKIGMADYSEVTYPYAQSTGFTYGFKVTP